MAADDYYIPNSQKWNSVKLHNKFVNGKYDKRHWTDYGNLTDAELDALRDFIDGILRKRDLVGCNKASWTDGKNHEIHAESVAPYKEWAAWHYHCGPTYGGKLVQPTEWWLPQNDHGRTSPEIVHYSKKQVQQPPGARTITIVAFSRNHVPFPPVDSDRSPIGERLRSLTDSQ
jgi:hypothetical protein